MRTGTLQKIRGIEDPKFRIPEGAKIVGNLPDGTPIIEETRYDPHATAKNKKPVLDENGEQVWVKDKRTGEKLKPRVAAVPVYSTKRWVPVKTPQGKVYRNYDFAETEESRVARERREKIQETSDTFAERLVDAGLTVDEFFEELGFRQGQQGNGQEEAKGEPQDPPTGFLPWKLVMISPGRWALPPDGEETFQGKKVEAAEKIRELGFEPMEEDEFEKAVGVTF